MHCLQFTMSNSFLLQKCPGTEKMATLEVEDPNQSILLARRREGSSIIFFWVMREYKGFRLPQNINDEYIFWVYILNINDEYILIRVIIQNSLYQNKNREEVKNREIRYSTDLPIYQVFTWFLFVSVQRILN